MRIVEHEHLFYICETERLQQHLWTKLHLPTGMALRMLMGSKQSATEEEMTIGIGQPWYTLVDGAHFQSFQNTLVAFHVGEYGRAIHFGHLCRRSQVPYQALGVASYLLYDGLSHLELFGQTQNRRQRRHHLRITKRNWKRLDRIVRTAPDLGLAKLSLLRAQTIFVTGSTRSTESNSQSQQSLKPRALSDREISAATRHYMTALSWAEHTENLMEAAVSNELYARFLLSIGTTDWQSYSFGSQSGSAKRRSALQHLSKACHLYEEWNGFHKAELLTAELHLLRQDDMEL